jgi:putative PIN family toxin of toxin-antitoxin system
VKLVLDTDVVLSGLISSKGASRQVLLDALDGRFTLLLSTPLLAEYEAVLCRPEHMARAKAKLADIIEFLDALAGLCTPVAFDYRWRPTGADTDDEMVIETGINGYADAVVTFNLKHMQAAGDAFGFRVMRPGALLRSLRS